jgi:hypothetical protein
MSDGENTLLLGGCQGRDLLWNDNRPYVRWPTKICRLIWLTAESSYLNVLLVLVRLGTIAGATSWNPTTIFVLNFFF